VEVEPQQQHRQQFEQQHEQQTQSRPKFTLKPAKIHRPGDKSENLQSSEIKNNEEEKVESKPQETQILDPNDSDSDSKSNSKPQDKDEYLDPNADSEDEIDPNAESDDEIDPNAESEESDPKVQNEQETEPIIESTTQSPFELKRQQIEKMKQMVAQYQTLADDLVESGKVDKQTDFDDFDDIVKETVR
jgi:hypothetical protein